MGSLARRLTALGFCFAACLCLAQEALNNEAIIKMANAGLDADLIVSLVNQKAGQYSVTADALIELKTAGVPDKVIAAILKSVGDPVPAAAPVPSNPVTEAVLKMLKAGLSEDVIVSVVNQRTETYTLSTDDLIGLKTAGVPNKVIAAMVAKSLASPATAPTSGAAVIMGASTTSSSSVEPRVTKVNYAISYVESNRKWKLGFRSEPYNKISSYIRDRLDQKLAGNGLAHVESIESGCCAISIELLEVTQHDAVLKKPGMDLSATVTVVDAEGHQVFAKGYRGESRTMLSTVGTMINHAAENLVDRIIEDGSLINAIIDATASRQP